MVILGEGAHLGGNLLGIEPEHLIDHQGVGNAVGQVVEGAQLVRHGMADAKEGVGEGHTRHGGGVCHVLPGPGIPGAVFVGGRQIFKQQLQSPQRQTVGIVRGHHGGVGLQSVGDGIDAGGGSEPLGGVHHHVRVHNGHVGHQLVIRQGVLDPGLLVGDHREGGHLGAGAGGGGNGHEEGLFAHFGEGIHPLADVRKAHGHILEVRFGMLVEHPHVLARVHGGAAAHGDDHIGLEGAHLLRAGLGAGQGGVGGYIGEAGVPDAHFVQFVLDGLGIAAPIQEGVGDDEGLFLPQHVLQLAESHGKAALLEINLLGGTEPQHILSPLGYGFDVQQVLDTHILRNGVAAPAAAAQGQGGGKTEVVQVTDAALRGGGVHQNPAGFHPGGESVQLLFGCNGV